jgi:hypothetical protein
MVTGIFPDIPMTVLPSESTAATRKVVHCPALAGSAESNRISHLDCGPEGTNTETGVTLETCVPLSVSLPLPTFLGRKSTFAAASWGR